MAHGLLLCLLISSPKYLNSITYSNGTPLQIILPDMLISIHLVLRSFILKLLSLQNPSKQFKASYKPAIVELSNTASSAKARKNNYKVHNSIIYFYSWLDSNCVKYCYNLQYTGSKIE